MLHPKALAAAILQFVETQDVDAATGLAGLQLAMVSATTAALPGKPPHTIHAAISFTTMQVLGLMTADQVLTQVLESKN